MLARVLSAPRALPIVLCVASAIVLLRSAVFLVWEQAGFDADQAVFGLMATHLAEGRAFPMFIYGAEYLLAVQAWLAAPLFAVLGPSVAVLKLPVVVINVVTACLLIWLLHRDAGLSPRVALLVSMFYVLAAPGMAASLVETGGGNPEPFLYVLLLWLLRSRPLLFGMVAAFGMLHREFTVYGVGAIVAISLLQSPRPTTHHIRAVVMAAIGFLLLREAARIAFLYSSPSGPGTVPVAPLGVATSMQGLLARVCFSPDTMAPTLIELFRSYLALPFGVDSRLLGDFGVGSSQRSAGAQHPWMWPLLQVTFALVLVRIVVLARRGLSPLSGSAALPMYLLLIGLQAGLVYALTRCGDLAVGTIRYALLAVYLGVGLIGVFVVLEPRRVWRHVVVAVVLVWCTVSASAHLRLVREYLDSPPPNVGRQLAEYLLQQGVGYAWSDYWTAYLVTFYAREKVIVASTDFVRIDSYQSRVLAEGRDAVWLSRERCRDGTGRPILDGRYWVCPP